MPDVLGVFRKTLTVIGTILAVLAAACGTLLLWWYWPVSVEAKQIVKVTSETLDKDQIAFCAAFTMTPEQFRAHWKDVRPIISTDLHGYTFGSCYFQATENGKEYVVSGGDVRVVTEGDTSYYYVRTAAKNDLSGLD